MSHRFLFLLIVGTLLAPHATLADARVVTGRTPAGREEARPVPSPSRWSLDFGAGMLAGGDLFRVGGEQTVTWPTPGGGSFQARTYEVTVDEDAAFLMGLDIRLRDRSSLRLDLTYAKADLTALANDSQYVVPVPWDRATFTRAGLVWEERLTDTRLRPYGVLGLGLTAFSAADGALDQTGLTLLAGVGGLYRILGQTDLRVEIRDGIRQLDSRPLVGDLLPEGVDLQERGPQHLVAITAGLRLPF